jgi:hypothetical protein
MSITIQFRIMATINLFEAAKTLKITKFSFISSQKVATDAKEAKPAFGNQPAEEAKPASFYLILELETPIEKVLGSNTMYDPMNNVRVPYVMRNVSEVRVHAETLEKYQSEFSNIVVTDASFSGDYEGDLRLDISNKDEVYLTDKKFSAMSQQYKAGLKLSRLNGLRDRLKD